MSVVEAREKMRAKVMEAVWAAWEAGVIHGAQPTDEDESTLPRAADIITDFLFGAPLPDDERPLGECGFNEPHEPHEYVVARDGRPVDLSCPGLPDDERLAAHRLHVALVADGLGCDGTHSLGYATCQRLARLAAPQGVSERSGE
jgi:hypothetical protein